MSRAKMLTVALLQRKAWFRPAATFAGDGGPEEDRVLRSNLAGRSHDRFGSKLLSGTIRSPDGQNLWKTANWHERETYDIVAWIFDGHPSAKHLLPSDLTATLRKDYRARL